VYGFRRSFVGTLLYVCMQWYVGSVGVFMYVCRYVGMYVGI